VFGLSITSFIPPLWITNIAGAAVQDSLPACKLLSNLSIHRARSRRKRMVHHRVRGTRSNNLIIRFFIVVLR